MYREYSDGEEVYEDDFNAFMSQSVPRFATVADRSGAISTPEDGQLSWTDELAAIEVWNGSGWVELSPLPPEIPGSAYAVPTGGSPGQALVKTSSTDYITGWQTLVPTGGTAGQGLIKDSGTNYAASWQTFGKVPTGGSSGQVLAKTSGTDYATNWVTPTPAPVTGTATLVAGTATVNTSAALTASKIFLTAQSTAGTMGFLWVSNRVNGVSFTITSSSNTDTSTVAWMIV